MINIRKNEPVVYVSFSAKIERNTAESLMEVMVHCANQQVKKVYLLLNTTGGDVIEGFNLYNVLKGMPFELVTHNTGNVNSMGIIVFLAGSKRYASEHSRFIFQGVGFDPQQQGRLERKELEEKLDTVVSGQKRMGSVITKETKMTEGEVDELFIKVQNKDAEFAVEKGFIQEIREVKIMDGCPVIQAVSKR